MNSSGMSLNFIRTYSGRSRGGLQVEVSHVKRGELGAGVREYAVENELGKFRGCCRGADVAGKGDAISADGDARAVGIALLWVDLANHFGVSDFLSTVGRDIFVADEEEGVGSLDLLASAVGGGVDTLAESAESVGVGIVPDLVKIWVLTELTVF